MLDGSIKALFAIMIIEIALFDSVICPSQPTSGGHACNPQPSTDDRVVNPAKV